MIHMDTSNTQQSTLRQYIAWKDLRSLHPWQVLLNLIMPYPFLGLSWWFAHHSLFVFALITSAIFFTASFRQAHDAFHNSLGLTQITIGKYRLHKWSLGKIATDALLCLMSGLLLTSTHAIKQTHLQHHRTPLVEGDVEAEFHSKPWYHAIIKGVPHWFKVQWHGMQLADHANKCKIMLDYGFIIAMLITTWVTDWQYLFYHVAVMCVGNSLVGFIAGWAVHHHCYDQIARTERNWLINLCTFNLLYHLEHHLFPAVPSCHLPKLAKRLDSLAPNLQNKRVVAYSNDKGTDKKITWTKLNTKSNIKVNQGR